MYVTSNGVTKEHIDRTEHSHSVQSIMATHGHKQGASSLLSVFQRFNSVMGLILIGAIVVSSGLAYAIRTRAEAFAPSSVVSFGKATSLGNPEVPSNDEVVSMASSPRTPGYWVVTRRGHVYPFGNADYGSIPEGEVFNISKITSTPSGKGYWLMATNGNVYTFGDAKFAGTPELNGITGRTFVALLPSPSGLGYLLVEQNGNTMAFGDAKDQGNALGQLGGDYIVDAKALSDGSGYLMVSSHGAVSAFGNALFNGGISSSDLQEQARGMELTKDGNGYWILTQNGAIYSFGAASYFGNALEANDSTGAPAIDLAINSAGDGYWIIHGRKAVYPVQNAVRQATTSQAVVATNTGNADNADVWARLRNCESHGNYQSNTGNGYYGAYQFSKGTWNSMNTGYAYAHEAPPEVQDDAARRLQARSGWGQWPVCSRNAGAR